MNTNMYVEAFHRVLKHLYLKGKINKRVDRCAFVLLKLARDKGFERIVKLEKGKNSGRINTIKQRHQSSKKLLTSSVQATDQYLSWKVTSADSKAEYHIHQTNKECPHNCSLKRADCNICVHIYYCDCPDALIKGTICKHIRLVARYRSEVETGASPTITTTERGILFEKSPQSRLPKNSGLQGGDMQSAHKFSQ